eukprot:COSAG04_NODE_2359_length_4275_cov_28.443008_2_plen_188_part_00
MSSQAAAKPALDAEDQAAMDAQLIEATNAGDAAAIERLAAEGASPDAKGAGGEPAVHRAAPYGHTAAVEALLRLGADPDATDMEGVTALMWAAPFGHAECARLLLEAGADASLRATGGDWEGKTALELAEQVEEQSWESDEEFAARQKGCLEVAALLRHEPEPEPEVTRSPPPTPRAPLARARSPTF